MVDERHNTASKGNTENRLLDDDSFILAAENAFHDAGRPTIDEVTKRRLWSRIETRLGLRYKGWKPLALLFPLAAAVVFYVFSTENGTNSNSYEGIKGIKDLLPVTLDVMEVSDSKRFLPLDTGTRVPPGTQIALMIRGMDGLYALVSSQIDDDQHEILTAGYLLAGQGGDLLISDQSPTAEIWTMRLPVTGKKIRLCAVASPSRNILRQLVPILRQAGSNLPPMMECQTILVSGGPIDRGKNNRPTP